ncbi:hypothetical protein, partial [Pseudomarimonas arenosa]|uniref:hypothetical protein n=1 Tax=Pseudomarimonas arenosa TaxID=2774145 RepID=UPI001CDC5019
MHVHLVGSHEAPQLITNPAFSAPGPMLIPTLQPNKHPAFGHFSIVVVNRRCDGNSVSGISQENAAG